jgi:predicted acylesterase/phospholipase RssA
MNKPMEFKVAFQGGGAKFVTLLAAVDALSLAQKTNKICFSHIIGSSAGGLAATLLGLESNISTLRATLQKEEVRNRLRKITIEKAGLSSLWKIFRGEPIIDEKHLHDLFSEILISVTGGNLDHTPDIKTRTSLVITNIRTSTSEIVDINGMKIRDIADNLVNTCAIPFVLRGFGAARNAHLVDGGLFENFPTSALTQDDYPNRRVIGITFKKSAPEVNLPSWGLLSYASHIISAAIDSNIEPSLKSLHQQNIIHLPNSWGTFDFKGALNSIGDKNDSHDSIRELVHVNLAEILVRERQVANLTKIKEKASVPQNYDQVRDNSALLFSHRSSSGMSKRCYIYLEFKSLQLDAKTATLGKEDYYFQRRCYT